MLNNPLVVLLTAASLDCGLVLELRPNRLQWRGYQPLQVSAILTNRGSRSLTLIMPGDGSLRGDRTPVVEWTFAPRALWGTGGCGNIDPLVPREVFELPVAESRDLGEWIRPSIVWAPSHFRIALTYSNEPLRPWRGVSLYPNVAEMARATAACRVTSNSVEVEAEAGVLERIQRAHVEANVPAASDFPHLLQRELNDYFSNIRRKAVHVEHEMLSDGPTQSGVGYPEFYLWVSVYEQGRLVDRGAVRIAAKQRQLLLTDFLSARAIRAAPATRIDRVLPDSACEKIKVKLASDPDVHQGRH